MQAADLCHLCGLKQKQALCFLSNCLSLVSYRPLASGRARSLGRLLNCDAACQLSSIQSRAPALRPLCCETLRHLTPQGLHKPACCTTHDGSREETASRAARPVAATPLLPARLLPARRRHTVLVQGTLQPTRTTYNLAARPPPARSCYRRWPREPMDGNCLSKLVPHGQAR